MVKNNSADVGKHTQIAPSGGTVPWLPWSILLLNSLLPVSPPQLPTLILLPPECCHHPDSPVYALFLGLWHSHHLHTNDFYGYIFTELDLVLCLHIHLPAVYFHLDGPHTLQTEPVLIWTHLFELRFPSLCRRDLLHGSHLNVILCACLWPHTSLEMSLCPLYSAWDLVDAQIFCWDKHSPCLGLFL